jgi:type I restriction enzyme S subunit
MTNSTFETIAVRRWKEYPQYEPTQSEWLGKIPSHWTALKIKRLCQVRRGASPRPIEDPVYFDEAGEYAWVRISDVTASEKYLFSTEERLSELGKNKSVALEPGRLFLSIAASVGKPIITKIKCCIHDGFVYFVGLKQDSEYLYYLFKSGQLFSGLGKLGTQLNLNTDTIGDIRIPLPPLPEQRAIATFLDRETARIDALIGHKERLIALLEEKRQAILSHAVIRGLNPAALLKDSGVPWLGMVPKDWNVTSFKRATKRVVVGIAEAATHAYTDEGVPIIRSTNVRPSNLLTDDLLFIQPWFAEQNRSKFLFAGDLVTVRTGYPGVTAVVPKSLHRSQCFTLLISTLKVDCNPAYFSFVLNSSSSRAYFEVEGWASAQLNISVPILQYLPVPIPPVNEQAKIVDYLQCRLGSLDATVERIRDGMARLQEYRTALISAAVTGQIDVRGEV